MWIYISKVSKSIWVEMQIRNSHWKSKAKAREGEKHTESSGNTNDQSFPSSKLAQVNLVGGRVLNQSIQIGDFLADFDECWAGGGEGAESMRGRKTANSESGSHCIGVLVVD